MTIENLLLINILVWVMAGLIIVQTVLLVVANLHIVQNLQNLDQGLRFLSEQSAKGLALAHRALNVIEKVLPKLPEAEEVMEKKMKDIVETTQKVDRAVSRVVDLIRYQMGGVDSGLDTFLSRLSQQIYRVHQAVLHPSLRLATIVRSGINVLKRTLLREDESPASHQPDEETFV